MKETDRFCMYKIDNVMNGDLQEILDACTTADQAAKLLKMGESA